MSQKPGATPQDPSDDELQRSETPEVLSGATPQDDKK